MKLLSFRSLLLKAIIKGQKFWDELQSKSPDQKKLINTI